MSDTDKPQTFTLRCTDDHGDAVETEMTAAQMLDFQAGRGVAYFVTGLEVLVDGDGEITECESAIPLDGLDGAA